MLAAGMMGNPEAVLRMSCHAEVPIEPSDMPALALIEPVFGQTPSSGVIIMAICKACAAKQITLNRRQPWKIRFPAAKCSRQQVFGRAGC
jgi:hypothetical protein